MTVSELIQRLTDRGWVLTFSKRNVGLPPEVRKVLCIEGKLTLSSGKFGQFRICATDPTWTDPDKLQRFIQLSLTKCEQDHGKTVVEIEKQFDKYRYNDGDQYPGRDDE